MFKVDFMSSLNGGELNGFDLAVLEELEKEDSEDDEDFDDYDEDYNPYEEPYDSIYNDDINSD